MQGILLFGSSFYDMLLLILVENLLVPFEKQIFTFLCLDILCYELVYFIFWSNLKYILDNRDDNMFLHGLR